MGSMPRISDSEWEVMKAVWKAGKPLSSDEIISLLAYKEWHPKTVRTLINRLVKKGALSCKKDGRAYSYAPAVGEKECIMEESQTLLDKLFGGSLAPMLANFVEGKRLGKQDIAELEEILRKSSKEG